MLSWQRYKTIFPLTLTFKERFRHVPMKKSMFLPIISLLMLVWISACKHDPYFPDELTHIYPEDTIPTNPQPCSTDTVYFANQIQPLLVSNCAKAGCHDAGTREKGYNFGYYDDFMNTDAFDGGNLGNSKGWDVIVTTNQRNIMPPPPYAPLTTEQKDLVRSWILQGARKNSCTVSNCDTTNVSLSTDIGPIFQTSCYGCHSTAAAQSSGSGIDLEIYNSLQTYANNGRLACSVAHDGACSYMPKGGNKLPSCQIEEIVAWVNAGGPNN
ncbi:hypothetical protein BH09BAC1_BH09BAC1_24170 [soil metagenome]